MTAVEDSIDLSQALIVEDDEATCLRLQRLLADLLGPGAPITMAGSLAEARACLVKDTAGLALIDIGLPDGNGVELIAWLHAHHPRITTVVVSAWGHEDTVLAALRAGAIGYLLKEREDIELSLALQSIGRGGAPIDPTVARRILAFLQPAAPAIGNTSNAVSVDSSTETLSKRESEILQLVARGYSNREIAELTALSRFTIEGYTKSIYRKLAVGSRTAAVFEAQSLGLLH